MNFFRQKIGYLFISIILLIALNACQTVPTTETQSPTATTTSTPVATETTDSSSISVAYLDRELSASPAQLPKLPYDYNALEKAIDAETMKLHHDRHHASYVDNLNNALNKYPDLQKSSVESMLRNLNSVPEDIRTKIRNNGGGHLNHTLFWQIMSANGGGQPTGELATEINKTFGDFETFRKQFNAAGGDRFGSGWVWLVRNPQGQLQITTTPNQDNPITEGLYPIMGNDVWEHAYYLRYRNRRAEYLNNWWNVVNWSEVNKRAQASLQQKT